MAAFLSPAGIARSRASRPAAGFRRGLVWCLVAGLLGAGGAPASGSTPAIDAGDLRAHVAYLADDAREGRLAGTKGAAEAARYIAAQLQRAGVAPLGEDGTYFQPFEFSAGVETVPNENRLTIAPGADATPATEFEAEKDFRPLAFSENGEVSGEVVFVGYGLTAPGRLGEGYDSYGGALNVAGKIVVALRYVPEGVEPARRAELNRYAGLRYKALVARTQGARALLVVTGPNSPNAGELVPLTYDTSLAGSGIVAASISARVAAALLAGSGRTLQQLQDALDAENPHGADVRFTVPNLTLRLRTRLNRLKRSDRNVLGAIPPANGRNEYVMVGAHFDHLGRGETGGFGIKGDEGRIHPGADDNASGVAAVLELAENLAAERRNHPAAFSRGIVFAFWSGEEIGLIGSSRFAEQPTLPLAGVVAYLNFDMVGRLRDDRLILQGVGSSPAWPGLIAAANVESGFRLVLQDDPYLPTDTTALYPKSIPVLAFFTGSHEQYHRPTDEAGTLNYEGLGRIATMARRLVLNLGGDAVRPVYASVAKRAEQGARDGLRAYLGTVPDYAAEIEGVKLSGVRAGSPADTGGVKAGDVIVELGGQKIANIYDYTYALEAVKIGTAVKIAVTRDGRRVELSLVPEARK